MPVMFASSPSDTMVTTMKRNSSSIGDSRHGIHQDVDMPVMFASSPSDTMVTKMKQLVNR
jgi:hypothetical protein